MRATLGQLKTHLATITRTAKIRKWYAAIVAVFIILQLYFVRELIAAELLFSLGFAVLLVLAGIFYVLGAIGERGLDLTEVGARTLAHSARRGYSKFEEISKKPFRHPRSESAR
jgi:energy-coupling factor transporter transmembrane protein EcfT